MADTNRDELLDKLNQNVKKQEKKRIKRKSKGSKKSTTWEDTPFLKGEVHAPCGECGSHLSGIKPIFDENDDIIGHKSLCFNCRPRDGTKRVGRRKRRSGKRGIDRQYKKEELRQIRRKQERQHAGNKVYPFFLC